MSSTVPADASTPPNSQTAQAHAAQALSTPTAPRVLDRTKGLEKIRVQLDHNMVSKLLWVAVSADQFMNDYLPTDEKFTPAKHRIELDLKELDVKDGVSKDEHKTYPPLVRTVTFFLHLSHLIQYFFCSVSS